MNRQKPASSCYNLQVLTAERRQAILARVERDGRVVASELVAGLGVSEDTVRRDLRDLAEQGLLQRVHGGALASAPATSSFTQRLEVSHEEKAALAEAALPLLVGARVIVLDGGTTNLELARRLPLLYDGTVVTNSPPVASALANHPKAGVMLVGGRLLKDSQVAVGAAAVEAFHTVRADICVLGICSLHPDVGVTTPDDEEAYVKRAMVASAGEVIALATSDKLRMASPWVVAQLADIDHLVTDGSGELTRPYTSAGIDVVAV
jgi:DeoR/GlpR family transcriptional regulator of sugar metabolism